MDFRAFANYSECNSVNELIQKKLNRNIFYKFYG